MVRRRMSWAALIIVGAIAISPLHPAVAAIDAWDDPVVVGPGRELATSARLVSDGSSLVALWQVNAGADTEVVSAFSADGVTWSPLRFLSAAGLQAAETQLVAGGGRVTAAWLQEIDDVYRVQVATSTNSGATWSAAATISPAGESASELQLATDGSTIIATWASQAGPDRRIRVATSSNGTSWSTALQLDIGDDARDPYPIIDGTTAVVAWASFDDGNFILESSASTTTGAVWSAPTALPNVGGLRPQLVYDGVRLTAVFPNFEGSLISRTSTDLGQTWPVVDVITSGIDGESYQLDVVAEGESITAIWWVIGAPDFVQVASSFDGGATWTAPEQLSTGGATLSTPQLAIEGNKRVAVWSETDGANRRALIATSANGGADWSTPTTLSVSGGNATGPWPVIAGLTTSVLWTLTVGTEAAVQVTSFTDSPDVSRLSGPDRYATAAAISGEFDAGVPIVYLATGTNYPDALSAASAAAAQGGPLLLTAPNSVPAVIAAELQRLDPALVVIAGGTNVVSSAVQSQVQSLLPDATIRRDSGANRFATSLVIAERAFAAGMTATAFIATGRNFPDALSASAAAGVASAPVVLVNGTASTVDAPTLDLLDTLGIDVMFIAGSTVVVSAGIQTALQGVVDPNNVTRLSGASRYDTSVAINANQFASADTVYLATGLGFADALAGAALAGFEGAPLYVIPRTCVPDAVLDEIDRLGASNVVLLGGLPALSAAVESLTPC